MTLTAVDLNAEGKPLKWKVENSWGPTYGQNGYLIMTDNWFQNYMFRLVVNKRYVPETLLKQFDSRRWSRRKTRCSWRTSKDSP